MALLLVLASMPAVWLPIAVTKPSQLVQWYLYLFVVVPAVIIPPLSLDRSLIDVMAFTLVLTACFALLSLSPYLPPLRLPRARVPVWMFWAGVGTAAGLLYAYVILVFGLPTRVPSLLAVYDTRAAYRAQLEEAGGVVAYAVLWLAKLFNPLFLAFGLVGRHPLLLGLGMAGQLLLYGITGFKSVIFTIVLLVCLLVAMRDNGRHFGIWMLTGSIAFVVAAIAHDLARDKLLLTGLFVRRMMLVPGLLTGMYFDFFSQNPPARFGNSFLKGLVDYPYPVGTANVIGSRFLGNVEGHANANLWADAYANFRMPGMVAVTAALMAVLWLFDSLASQRRRRETILIAAVPAFALCNSSLQTVFVTHGLALALLVSALLPADRTSDDERQGPHAK
jgi:hypothetical protein